MTAQVQAKPAEVAYTEAAGAVAVPSARRLIAEALEALRPALREADFVVDGSHDPSSGEPTLVVRAIVPETGLTEARRAVRAFQSGDWWWERRKDAGIDVVFSVAL